jgi:outer membrane protein OmpA-like peptidoglycan-associated protein
VGVKIGFHFLPCKNRQNDEYMRDVKRRFMEEMMNQKQKDPVVVTNTVQEYYYFVPTVSPEVVEEAEKDPVKKKDVQELAETLAKIKILFNLDKDIPLLDDYKRDQIKKASDILKANPTLKVVISGYTSPEGSKEHNMDLGHRRALAVRKIFIEQHGVPADQVTVQNFTAEDEQHKLDRPEKEYSEQRAVIFRIEKK